MSMIVVGDLHGDLEITKYFLKEKNKQVCFLMDVLDSFTFSREDQFEALQLILYAIASRNNIVGVLANHELSYANPYCYRASGFSNGFWTRLKYSSLIRQIEQLPIVIEAAGFLITHAGISKTWLPDADDNYWTADEIIDYIEYIDLDTIAQVGVARGGTARCGGPLWCDYWSEFVPVPGIKQVMGHSAYRPEGERKGIVVDGHGNWNIDCLQTTREVLEISDNHAAIVKF